MELNNQIKRYRTDMDLSQEALAEKVYVTRQTISNWENGKSYPDIHSLLLLSSVFHVTIDQLIKGDVKIMKEVISQNELRTFNRDSTIFASLLILSLLSFVPLTVFFGFAGLIIFALLYAAGMYYAVRVEKLKKKYDIQTYREIVAFTEGKKLDEIEKARESGKRPYQKFLLALAVAIITFLVGLLFLSVLGTG
ncbi:MAG: helix-turn-helix transcriptional regulator [Dorea sp.]|nr:helix-turn-helix transcriptional regulator [Dorea sp.]